MKSTTYTTGKVTYFGPPFMTWVRPTKPKTPPRPASEQELADRRKIAKKRRDEISPCYVAASLKLKVHELTPEIIDLFRLRLSIKRELKHYGYPRRNARKKPAHAPQ